MTPRCEATVAGRRCAVEGCRSGVAKRGFCAYHYTMVRSVERADEGKVCSVDGCSRGWFARRLCRGHYTTVYSRERRARLAAARAVDAGGASPDAPQGEPGTGPGRAS